MTIADILKKENIIECDPEESLSHCLSKLSTSHDAAFVFDAKKFSGVINPYYSLIRSSHPGNAKVMHCLHHPPKVYLDHSLAKVAELLMESKIHYLPVFNNKEIFVGIISARHLLYHLGKLPIFNVPIQEILSFRKRPLTVIYDDESVAQAINQFRKTKLSKLVVIDKDLKLKGILSYYDLISFMMIPRSSKGRREKEGNKTHLGNLHVKNFIKTYVLTLKKDAKIIDAFRLILEKKIGSVVIIDEERHPINVITTRDLLRFYVNSQKFNVLRNFSSKIGKLLQRKKNQ